MESLNKVLERHKGKMIEVVTNAGQKLVGIAEEANDEFFTLSAVTLVYVIPYTGISTLLFYPDQAEIQKGQQLTSFSVKESPLKKTRKKKPERKTSPIKKAKRANSK